MPQPLPSQLPESLNHSDSISEIRSAYSKILQLEKAAADADREVREKRLIYARILGYLIREGPSIQASKCIAEEVNLCEDNDQMNNLGELYHLQFIRPFKKYKGPTPSPSTHSSRPSFETKKEMMVDMLRESDEPPRSHAQAKKNALIRDNFRCIVSGNYDSRSAQKNHELLAEVDETRSKMGSTQCAHIFPQSTNMDISGDQASSKLTYAATLWTILKLFGYGDLPKKMCGDGVNSLDNIMTLDSPIHSWFDELQLWFEAADGQENTYNIRATAGAFLHSCKPNPIVLTSARPDFPLPNPVYLSIHAACCRVAHLSGAGEYIDKILEDLEGIRVLAKDGSSARLLSFALQSYSQEIVA